MRDIFDLGLAILAFATFAALPLVWVVSHVR